MASHQQQKDLVREQFTRTAQVFGDYAIASLGGVAERLARHVRWICGLDLTPAILERARRTAAAEGLANLEFAIGDAQSLPFPDASVDIALTSYSVHHFPDRARTIGEMTRVVRRGGRVGILDIFLADDAAISELNTRTLQREVFESNFAGHGLRLLETSVEEKSRSFDDWMLVVGLKPGDPNYVAAWRLMEVSIPNDAAWFYPRFEPGKPELVFTNTTFVIAGEKL